MEYSRYQDLIPSSHLIRRDGGDGRTNFDRYVEMALRQGIDFANLMESYVTAFNLDTATGAQLDILGALVGISRNLSVAVEGLNAVLDDDAYRLLIRGKIVANSWDGTNAGLVSMLQDVFQDYEVSFTDNMDMSISFAVDGEISDNERLLILNGLVLMVPAGMGASVAVGNSAVIINLKTATAVSGQAYDAQASAE